MQAEQDERSRIRVVLIEVGTSLMPENFRQNFDFYVYGTKVMPYTN